MKIYIYIICEVLRRLPLFASQLPIFSVLPVSILQSSILHRLSDFALPAFWWSPSFLVVQGGSNSGPSLATSFLPFVGYDHIIQVSFFFNGRYYIVVHLHDFPYLFISDVVQFRDACTSSPEIHFKG